MPRTAEIDKRSDPRGDLPSVAGTPTARSGASTEAANVLPLVRRLVDHARGSARSAARGSVPGERVLLDVEVEGVRCLLIAARPAPLGEQTLSPREQEIARMVAQGYPNKTIAAVLDISSWTVSTHLRRIFAKLGVRSRAAMVARVVEEGLVREAHQPVERALEES